MTGIAVDAYKRALEQLAPESELIYRYNMLRTTFLGRLPPISLI